MKQTHQNDLVLELPAENHPDKTVVVGQKVTIHCYSSNAKPVNWWYQRTADKSVQELCVNGELINGHVKRFSLNPSNYDLTLLSAKWQDGGLYTCVEDTGFSTRHIIHLTVKGIHFEASSCALVMYFVVSANNKITFCGTRCLSHCYTLRNYVMLCYDVIASCQR